MLATKTRRTVYWQQNHQTIRGTVRSFVLISLDSAYLFRSNTWEEGGSIMWCVVWKSTAEYMHCLVNAQFRFLRVLMRRCFCIHYEVHLENTCLFYNAYILLWWISGNHYDVIKWKNFPRNWPFMRWIHRSLVNSPHKGQWRGALMLFFLSVSE